MSNFRRRRVRNELYSSKYACYIKSRFLCKWWPPSAFISHQNELLRVRRKRWLWSGGLPKGTLLKEDVSLLYWQHDKADLSEGLPGRRAFDHQVKMNLQHHTRKSFFHFVEFLFWFLLMKISIKTLLLMTQETQIFLTMKLLLMHSELLTIYMLVSWTYRYPRFDWWEWWNAILLDTLFLI